jgi:hypothetical protein
VKLLGPVPSGEEWTWLGSRDPKRAGAAAAALVADPRRALAVLSAGLARPEPTLTSRLLADLGDEEFRKRERAERALAALGVSAEPALHTAVTRSASPEVRARADVLLRALGPTHRPLAHPRIHANRAVGVLERIGSPEAAALLTQWTRTYPDTPLAAEAIATLARLAKKAP